MELVEFSSPIILFGYLLICAIENQYNRTLHGFGIDIEAIVLPTVVLISYVGREKYRIYVRTLEMLPCSFPLVSKVNRNSAVL